MGVIYIYLLSVGVSDPSWYYFTSHSIFCCYLESLKYPVYFQNEAFRNTLPHLLPCVVVCVVAVGLLSLPDLRGKEKTLTFKDNVLLYDLKLQSGMKKGFNRYRFLKATEQLYMKTQNVFLMNIIISKNLHKNTRLNTVSSTALGS